VSASLLSHAPPSTPTCSLSLHDALPIFGIELLPFVRVHPGLGGISRASGSGRHCRRPLQIEVDERLRDLPPLVIVGRQQTVRARSEEHTSELQSRFDLVCRLLLEKKNDS